MNRRVHSYSSIGRVAVSFAVVAAVGVFLVLSSCGTAAASSTGAPSDGVFRVTVTDFLDQLTSIRGYFHPRPGNKYVVVCVSQENISSALQVYSGRFTLQGADGKTYDPVYTLSNFWAMVLRPGALNLASLTYEMPAGVSPSRLVLATHRAPLSVPLR